MRFPWVSMVTTALCLGLTSGAMAQDRAKTLADIRQELSMLYVEVQKLRIELSTTQGASVSSGNGGLTQRVSALEGELARLTGSTEQLEFRINSIVKDGTNRIGDLEFRLVELEGGDVSKLGETSTLGGGDISQSAPESVTQSTATSELAIGEAQDFEAATQAYEAGEYARAAQLYSGFLDSYPGGPLTSKAHFQRGEALRKSGDTKASARAYLTSFSGAPNSDQAPDALYRLGSALGELGQKSEACATLAEVAKRFPSSQAVSLAQNERVTLGCQ